MSERPSFPFRLLQRSLKAVSRASSAAVDRVLRSDASPGPVVVKGAPSRTVSGAVRVRFLGEKTVEVEVQPGVTVLEAAKSADVDLRYYCGGNCSCGTCRVEIVEGASSLSRVESMESFVLGDEHQKKGDRLACQAQLRGPVTIRIPEWF